MSNDPAETGLESPDTNITFILSQMFNYPGFWDDNNGKPERCSFLEYRREFPHNRSKRAQTMKFLASEISASGPEAL